MWRALGRLVWSAGVVVPGLVMALTPSTAPDDEAGPQRATINPSRVLLVCEAAYLPSRMVWKRTVTIDYDKKRVLAVAIDGVPVYAFSVRGTVIFTSQDNERIQVDTATQSWTSDLRGLANSKGHCERGA